MNRSSPSKLFSLLYPSIVLFVVLAGPLTGWALYPSPAMPFLAAHETAAAQPEAVPCAQSGAFAPTAAL